MRAMGARSGVAAIAVAVGCTVTACASRMSAPDSAAALRSHPATPSSGARDARLFGFWTVTAARVRGTRALHADSLTTASLEFRRDGAIVTNGDGCRPATHFTTSAARIDLHWPTRSNCYGATATSPHARRIAHILDKLTQHSHIAYAWDNRGELTVAAGRYRAVLAHGRSTSAPPTIGPSTPVPDP